MKHTIKDELLHHLPFTFLGGIAGIALMILFRHMPQEATHHAFYILHPLHVLLSAIATTSFYRIYRKNADISRLRFAVEILCIGYVGSVGIGTLSDSLLPFLGEVLLDMPHRHAHIGFIEKWYIINPLALLGILIAYIHPATKVSHTSHVLLSTFASLMHIAMALGDTVAFGVYAVILAIVVFSVWVPCCLSDIVFPLLFVKNHDH